jgi:hypothetical protein
MQTAGTTLFGQFLATHPQLIVAAVPSRKEEK